MGMIYNRKFLVTMISFLIIGIVGIYFILDFFLFNFERLHIPWTYNRDAGPWPLIIAGIGCVVMILIGSTGIWKYIREKMWIK